MVVILGEYCASCGSREKLEFDCINPCGDRHHRMTAPARISFYRAQMRKGNLQLLCSECNSLKGDMTAAEWHEVMLYATERTIQRNGACSPGKGPDTSPEHWREIIRALITF